MAKDEPILLNDEQMRQFVTEGVLVLKTDFPRSFHERLVQRLSDVYEEYGNPGNNILPRIRELQKVFDHPVVTGALTSVLGPDYVMHTHRHGHYNSVPAPGGWHKDSYWGYNRIRNHHPWWAMIMYFPQDTPSELGPTGVLPGSQYHDSRTFDDDEVAGEITAKGEAGTFVLIHYDIWHRSTANMLGKPRFMLKFEFMRRTAPSAPTWDNKESEWRLPKVGAQAATGRQDALWEEQWRWLRGGTAGSGAVGAADGQRLSALEKQLRDLDDEPSAMNAAYELARSERPGIERLSAVLRDGQSHASKLAAYGLSVAGEGAVPELTEALDNAKPEVVNRAAFALGELGGLSAAAVPKLAKLLREHDNTEVRRTIAETLGMIDGNGDVAVDALIGALRDPDDQVRFTAGLSFIRLGPAASQAIPALEKSLDDANRYVRGHAALALQAIGTAEANRLLFRELFNLRWCEMTTKESTF